jgi:hypothetical protein
MRPLSRTAPFALVVALAALSPAASRTWGSLQSASHR